MCRTRRVQCIEPDGCDFDKKIGKSVVLLAEGIAWLVMDDKTFLQEMNLSPKFIVPLHTEKEKFGHAETH